MTLTWALYWPELVWTQGKCKFECCLQRQCPALWNVKLSKLYQVNIYNTNVRTYWLLIKDPEQNAAGESISNPSPLSASLSLKEEL